MKHSNHAQYPDFSKLETPKPLWQKVLNVLYVVACFVVVILLWTGL